MTTQPLRIALISEHASPLAALCGAEAGAQHLYFFHVAQGLAAAGHQVDVLTRRVATALPAVVHPWRGVRVLHIDAGPLRVMPKEEWLLHMPAFAEVVRRSMLVGQRYDVLHAGSFLSGWVGLALRRASGVPLVTTFHTLGLMQREDQGDADPFAAARIGIECALAQRSDRLIAGCPQDSGDLIRLYGAPPGRIATVPCGVDIRAFRPGDKAAARQRLGLPAERFLVLQVGPLIPRKGIDNLIQAMALLGPGIDAQLLLVGGASGEPGEQLATEIARLRGLARAHGVAQRVHFAVRRDREPLRDWYLAADVLVTTPGCEPCGITALEAMACGRPVIGSAAGGIQHTVVDGLTGFVVPPMDPQALVVRLGFLQANPALGAAMGRAGAQQVRRHHTWARIAHRLTEVYADVRDATAPSAAAPGRRAAHLSLVPRTAAPQLTPDAPDVPGVPLAPSAPLWVPAALQAMPKQVPQRLPQLVPQRVPQRIPPFIVAQSVPLAAAVQAAVPQAVVVQFSGSAAP